MTLLSSGNPGETLICARAQENKTFELRPKLERSKPVAFKMPALPVPA